jgi:hypothetical protein
MHSAKERSHFEISFRYEREYLCAEVSGPTDSYHITTQYWQRIAEELDGSEYKRLLIVETLGENIDVFDGFRAIRDRDREKFAGVRIAFFDAKPDHAPINSFCAAAAAHTGYEVEVFSDIADAVTWLLSPGGTDYMFNSLA